MDFVFEDMGISTNLDVQEECRQVTARVVVIHGHVLCVKLQKYGVNDVVLTERQFESLFPGAQDILNNALEAEAEERQNETLRD